MGQKFNPQLKFQLASPSSTQASSLQPLLLQRATLRLSPTFPRDSRLCALIDPQAQLLHLLPVGIRKPGACGKERQRLLVLTP